MASGGRLRQIEAEKSYRERASAELREVEFALGDLMPKYRAANDQLERLRIRAPESGTVTRMTGELEPRTRTMLIEVHLDNSDGFITPGSFAYVTLHVPVKSYITIPVSGLITRGEDNIVGVLENDVVRFRTVTVATTDGSMVSLSDGLKAGERVAINLPNEVTNGSRVLPISMARR